MREFDESDSDESLTGAANDEAVTLEHDPQGVTIRVVGELDLSTAPQVADVLAELNGAKPGRLLLDLDEVEFMDSAGLGVVLRAKQTAEQHGYRLAVRYASAQVHRLLEITGLVPQIERE